MHRTKSQRGQAQQEKSGCKLQGPRLLQCAAIIKVIQNMIFYVLATQWSPHGRSITTVAQDQLSKGPKSRRCNNTAMHRGWAKSQQNQVWDEQDPEWTSTMPGHLWVNHQRLASLKNRGRCNNRLMQRGIKNDLSEYGMHITCLNTNVSSLSVCGYTKMGHKCNIQWHAALTDYCSVM